MRRTFLLALLASWSLAVVAIEALPRAAAISGDGPAAVALKGLLQDYTERLPEQTVLSWTGDDFSTRYWSRYREDFERTCRADPAACAPLLRAQYDVLMEEIRKIKPGQLLGLREAVVISALSDFCSLGFGLDMGDRCFNKDKTAALASIAWRHTGREHLFLAYREAELGEIQTTRAWLDGPAKLSAEEKAAALRRIERDAGALERDAYASELRDFISDAASQWLLMLTNAFRDKPDFARMAMPLANLARLSAVRGRFEDAEQWWRLFQDHLAQHPEPGSDAIRCFALSQRFDIDVEIAAAGNGEWPGPERLQTLVGQGCPYTAQALNLAFQAARRQQPARAQESLRQATLACSRDRCGYSRVRQMEQLTKALGDDPVPLGREADYWQERLKRDGLLLSAELRIVWALAEQLLSVGVRDKAGALYESLDSHLDVRRTTGASLDDFGRREEIKRMRVRLDVESGSRKVMPEVSERLRGQNLLRRLQMERWEKELAAHDDGSASAERDGKLDAMRKLRGELTRLQGTDVSPAMRWIVQAMLNETEDYELPIRIAYLEKLAAKKTGTDSWLRLGSSLQHYANLAGNAADDALASDEAYLSWLRVPGGYIATLTALPLRGPQTILAGQHSGNARGVWQKFIPFGSDDEAVLRFYREMLKTGTTSSRGARVTAPLEAGARGFVIDNRPIWLRADGGFSLAGTAPAGARRIASFADLSDALYERLLAPFAEQYQDAVRLIISPDGELAFLPFETLTRRGISVLEAIDVAYVQSLAVFAELKKRAMQKKATGEPFLLSVADPEYATPVTAETQARTRAGSAARGARAIEWLPLPGTRKESVAITGIYRKHRQLLGAQASKAGLATLQAQQDFRKFQVLHFATHGYVGDDYSALVLSSGKEPAGAYLMDREIAGWRIDSDLVLLSACNTGIGRRQSGEGIVGLPYAFFMAGNINTLMSLWEVDDAGTAALMPAFVQRIRRGEDHVTALSNVKRAFARGDFGPALRNPRIWSAFVLYGVPLGVSAGAKQRAP